MWELWSGAQTPYLDLRNQEVKGKVMEYIYSSSHQEKYWKQFPPQLLTGHRLEKPENCPDEVYTVMRECWNLVSVNTWL